MKQLFAFLIAASRPFPPPTRKPHPAPRPATTTPSSASRPSGLGKGDPALDQWPNLLQTWLCAQGLLTAGKSAIGATP